MLGLGFRASATVKVRDRVRIRDIPEPLGAVPAVDVAHLVRVRVRVRVRVGASEP